MMQVHLKMTQMQVVARILPLVLKAKVASLIPAILIKIIIIIAIIIAKLM